MEQTVSPTESNHKKLPFANSFATKASLNNHKKPGQGKKLVIKNRKGEWLELGAKWALVVLQTTPFAES